MRFCVITIMSFVSSHLMVSVQEIIGQLRRNVAAKNEKESCPIYQDGKCIWPFKAGEATTTFVSAVSICAESGRKLAEVQSKKQYELIVSYTNPWLSERKDGEFSIWIGMVNNQTLSDGTKHIWWTAPMPLKETEKVAIHISAKEPMHKLIYMKEEIKLFGAICQ
uniref:uncharacterized protein LOC120329979 isoform X4 n=1 Tax=Styela clava TaxID=7725 RepID=UPI00193A7F34|nr:uncharacterized protein LOC120329979 isoform X4 [Styela clava]